MAAKSAALGALMAVPVVAVHPVVEIRPGERNDVYRGAHPRGFEDVGPAAEGAKVIGHVAGKADDVSGERLGPADRPAARCEPESPGVW